MKKELPELAAHLLCLSPKTARDPSQGKKEEPLHLLFFFPATNNPVLSSLPPPFLFSSFLPSSSLPPSLSRESLNCPQLLSSFRLLEVLPNSSATLSCYTKTAVCLHSLSSVTFRLKCSDLPHS